MPSLGEHLQLQDVVKMITHILVDFKLHIRASFGDRIT